MKTDIELDTHHPVGPYINMYDHAPVTVLGSPDHGAQLWVCLDCGYTVEDNRLMLHEDCEREDNGIAQTWREFLRENEFPE